MRIGGEPQRLSPRHQLPAATPLTGRDDILDELARTLGGGGAGAAISGLQGMGGVGKTALAVALAHRLIDRYPDAQLFLNLRGAGADAGGYRGSAIQAVTPAEAMEQIIHSFHPDARLPEALDDLTPIYLSVLAEAGRVLLLLDNAADAAQVSPLLPPAGCLLLVTSRTQFAIPGLTVHRLACLAPDDSCALLLRLAPRLHGSESDDAVLCGHLPLALAVFAGAVNHRSLTPVPELLTRLRQRKDRLGEVDAAFEVSASLLDEETRRDWTLLAVFPASFDLRAVAAVWQKDADTARDALQTLVTARLVEWDEAAARFRLHDLVRQFCEGKLSDTDRDSAHLRHAAHYRDVGYETAALYLKGGENVRAGLDLFDRERVQLEAAFDWLVPRLDRDSARLLLSLVNAVVYTSNLRFHPRQSVRWLEAQRDAAHFIEDREQEGNILGNLGNAYFDLGDARKAIDSYEQSQVVMREIGDRRGECNNLSNLGNAYRNVGDVRKAIEFFEQALVVIRETGDPRGEGCCLGNVGLAYADLGDARKAIEFYEQHLVIAREIGDRHGEGNTLGNLGTAYADLGDARKAIDYHEQRLVIAREIGDRRGEGNALGSLGNAYGNLGDARKAIEFYEQHLVIAREIGDRRGEGSDLWNSAPAFDLLGEKAEAIRRAEAALQIREAIEAPDAAKVRTTLAKWRAEGK